MNAPTAHPTFVPSASGNAFDVAVILTVDGQLLFVEDVGDARKLLLERFPDPDGPSFKRALSACDACLLGSSSGATARIMFIVAAMEAAYPFEVIEDAARAFERRIELEAELGLRSILLGEAIAE